MATDFVTWLTEEMQKRDWSISELARRAHVSHVSISNILSGNRKPGAEICNAISRALHLPPIIVFQQAGLFPPDPEDATQVKELSYLFNLLDEDAQETVLIQLRALVAAKEAATSRKR